MKKVISFVLAISILLCAGVSTVWAAKITAEEKLASIQKIDGFIPGKKSNPSNNCFKFVSNVCEKLYGETYYYEKLHDNYLADHDSGKYYTVKTLVINKTTLNEADARKIRDFFVNNAKAGDVVHYGGYNGGSTHTIMVNHIDSNKMQIYHSNYYISDTVDSTTCHIETILWDNFVKNPTKNESNSFNAIFYNKMKSSGLGISINRFTDYDKLFASGTTTTTTPTVTTPAVITPKQVTGLTVTSVSSETIAFKWDAVKDAKKYYVYVTNNTQKTSFNKTVTSTSTTISPLTDKNEYTIKVRAISTTNTNGKYSEPVTVVAKNTISKVKNVQFTSSTTTSLALKWDAVKGAKNYHILIKNLTKDSEFSKDVATTSTTLNNFTPGNVYSVRIRAEVGDNYGEYSSVVRNCTNPNKPKISSVTSPKKKSISASWNRVKDYASGYRVYYSTDSKFKKDVKTVDVSGKKTINATINNLKSGKTYYVKVRAYRSFGSSKIFSSYSKVLSVKCK